MKRKEMDYAYSNCNPKYALEPFHSWIPYNKHFDVRGLDCMFLEKDYTLFDRVGIIFTSGDTPGYQIVRVDLNKEGTLILSSIRSRKFPGFAIKSTHNVYEPLAGGRSMFSLTWKPWSSGPGHRQMALPWKIHRVVESWSNDLNLLRST